MEIVKVENLSHKYSSQWAIKDIDFKINQNGVIGLLGSNGAGKSTLMNIMCGALDQTVGSVYINGEDLMRNPVEAKKHIGFLLQKAPLHIDLTVDEYLIHCARLRLMKEVDIQDAINVAKTKCGIMHFSDRLIRNLSGGYQQRVGIAQAIVHDPQFVVLDEPTNGLDPNQIIEVRHLIKQIAKDRAVLVSTHILSEVEAICDYIRMIENGIMVFEGTIKDFNNQIETRTVFAELKQPPTIKELGLIDGVESVTALNELGEYRFKFVKERDITQEIIKKSIENNWELNQINIEKVSLDEVFAVLSQKVFINEETV